MSMRKGKGFEVTMNRSELLEKSYMISDGIALFPKKKVGTDAYVMAVSMNKTYAVANIRLSDCKVLSTNMSNYLINRSILAVKRNREQLIEGIKRNAKIHKR